MADLSPSKELQWDAEGGSGMLRDKRAAVDAFFCPTIVVPFGSNESKSLFMFQRIKPAMARVLTTAAACGTMQAEIL